MNAWGEDFDVWSKHSIERQGKLSPSEDWISKSENLNNIICHMTEEKKSYIEKMPEHIFRVEALVKAFPSSKFIYASRCWVDVALSISVFTNSQDWYGYESCKWLAL